MRTVAFVLASACALAACAPAAPQRADTAAPASAAAVAAPFTYRCDNGATLVAAYPTSETATVQYQGATHQLQIARSGSGARYVGSGLEWWTKGREGALSRLGADGFGAGRIAQCHEP